MDLLRAGLFCIVKRFRYPREAIGCLGGVPNIQLVEREIVNRGPGRSHGREAY